MMAYWSFTPHIGHSSLKLELLSLKIDLSSLKKTILLP